MLYSDTAKRMDQNPVKKDLESENIYSAGNKKFPQFKNGCELSQAEKRREIYFSSIYKNMSEFNSVTEHFAETPSPDPLLWVTLPPLVVCRLKPVFPVREILISE